MTDATAAAPTTTATPSLDQGTAQSIQVAQSSPAPAESAPYDWSSAGLDPITKGYVETKGWKSPTDLLSSYRNLEKLTGVPADKLVKLPTDANPEAWNDVYTKLGRPASPDKYEMPVPKGDDGTFSKEAAKWFHETGLSKNQASKLAEKWNSHMEAATAKHNTATAQRYEAEVSGLKSEWGANFQANSALVDRAAVAFGMDAAQIEGLRAAMGPAAAMKFLHNLGSRVAVEDRDLVGVGSGGNGFSAMNAQQAMARIAELRRDRTFVQRFTSSDPKTRGEARQEMDRLHRFAYPST